MTTKHHISHAEQLFWGAAFHPGHFAQNGRKGMKVSLPVWVNIGAPDLGDVDSIIDAATSPELPDTETVTYTPDTDNTSPTDGALGDSTITIDGVLYWELDVPRNIVCQTTHGSSIVAMTVAATGLDQYYEPMSETITIAATGTDETDAGTKAFKYLRSVAITAVADAEANTLNVGFGDVLGLPYRADFNDQVIVFENGDPLGSGTFAAADDTAATATTDDVRGTLDPNTALNGTVRISVVMFPDPTSKESLFGVDQYAG